MPRLSAEAIPGLQAGEDVNNSGIFQIAVYNRIRDIDPNVWNSLIPGHSQTFSHEFWDLVEQSGLNDFRYRHALFRDANGQPAALATFYTVTTDIAIFAPAGLRKWLSAIRKFYPRFLMLSMLECGTPITLNSPPIVVRPDIDTGIVLRELHQLLLQTARQEGQLLIVVRDFEPNAATLEPVMQTMGYCVVPSLPNNYLDIRWNSIEDYRASMKSYYRSKLTKHLKRNQTLKVRHEVITDFHDMADLLCSQWMVVHEQADEFQREVLTPEFYRRLSRQMGDRSKVILYYRDDMLVGHALLLHDGDMLRWLYFGREEAGNDSLYIYVAHSVIETAIALGVSKLEMGLTTYSIKQDLGAQVTPINLALRAPSALINPLVSVFYPMLNSVPALHNKNVMKSA